MAKHKTDMLGHPTDPKLRKLEDELELLAGLYRSARRDGDEEIAKKYVKEYQKTLNQMYEFGWNGFLDMMSLIPREYMPERYLRENPLTDFFGSKHHQQSAD